LSSIQSIGWLSKSYLKVTKEMPVVVYKLGQTMDSYTYQHTGWYLSRRQKMATSVIYTIGSDAPLNREAADAYGDYCFCCGRKLGKNVYLMHVNTAWQIVAPQLRRQRFTRLLPNWFNLQKQICIRRNL
jgi:hypothetical protein